MPRDRTMKAASWCGPRVSYREWIYLSSGLGMNYNPTGGGPELFTNAFVPQ